MAVQTITVAPTHSNDATFRTWGSNISAGISAAGLVQTADTGQINWATVTRPTTNTKAGYEIYRFNDGLQATRPIFVRFDYGTGGSVSNPQMWISVGMATDGAGVLAAHANFPMTFLPVANAITTWYSASSVWPSSTAWPIYIDSDGGSSFMMAGWLNQPGSGSPTLSGGVTVIERSRDMDGTPNGEGLFVYLARPSDGQQYRCMWIENSPWLAMQPGGQPNLSGVASTPFVTASLGTPAIAFFNGLQHFHPIFTGATPRLNGPSKHIVTVPQPDLPVLATFPLSHYGQTRTWMATGTNISVGGLGALAFRIT